MMTRARTYDANNMALDRAMYSHFLIAVACVPFYLAIPVQFGLLISPYLLWMLFKGKGCFVPALFLHICYGSQHRYVLLAGCFVYAALHVPDLIRRRLTLAYLLSLIPFPLFVWLTWKKYQLYGGLIASGGTTEGLAYYFGLFPFFWGAVAVPRLRNSELNLIVWMSIFFAFFHAIALHATAKDLDVEGWFVFTRYTFYAYPLCAMIGVRRLSQLRFDKQSLLLILILLLMTMGGLGVVKTGVTFSLFGVFGFAVLIYLFRKMKSKVSLYVLTSFLFFAGTWWAQRWMMDNQYRFYQQTGTDVGYSDMVVTDFRSFLDKLQRKAFDDRATLWCATWNMLEERDEWFLPPLERENAFIDTENQGRVEIELQAHNLFLEMVANYNWFAGLGLFLAYVVLVVCSGRYLRTVPSSELYYPFAAIAFTTGVVGAFTGQYPLTNQFSFVLMSVLGIAYHEYWNVRHNKGFVTVPQSTNRLLKR